MTTFPPYLKRGNSIGLVAPAGFMPFEKMQACIETFTRWGYHIKLGATAQSGSLTYFSGTDEERLEDLQHLMDDKNIQAILCVRGGYGLSRIVDRIDFKKFRKQPKWIIGYSDVTVLHAHIHARYKIATLHAPMAAAFMDDGGNNAYLHALKDALEGEPAHYQCLRHAFNREGRAKGPLVGGNLTLLAHLVGTPSDINTKNKILFLEDVGEYLYNIDRMLVQLKRSGKLEKLAGLIVGGFTECKDTQRPYGKTAYEIIHEHIKEYTYPVCFGFPVSHAKENYALKIGGVYRLQVDSGTVELKESFSGATF